MSELKVHASACDTEPMVQIDDLRKAFSERLKEALEANNAKMWGVGARLAKFTGVTPKAASKWLNGEAIPSGAKMFALAAGLNVRIEWLEYGRGDMREPSPDAIKSIDISSAVAPIQAGDFQGEVNDEKYAIIPQYRAYASAGLGHENPHVELRSGLAFKREWLKLKGVHAKNLKVVYAHGDSMYPTINDRDVLLVDESKIEPVAGQIFVIEGQDRGTIVKRLIKSDFGGWIIRSDNADKISYGDEVLPDDEIYEHRIIGRVIWRGGDL
jgi:phage repressor protein C with HTH and peptisase S24 domain